MNHFERVAIFTTIESIEGQLRGLKTLIAASAQGTVGSTSTKIPVPEMDSHTLSEDQEIELEKAIESERQAKISRMEKEAEAHFSKQWKEQAGSIDKQ